MPFKTYAKLRRKEFVFLKWDVRECPVGEAQCEELAAVARKG